MEFSDASETYEMPEPPVPKKKGPPVQAKRTPSGKNLLSKARHEEPQQVEEFDVHVNVGAKEENVSFLPPIVPEEEKKFDPDTLEPATKPHKAAKRPLKNIDLSVSEDPPAAQPSPGPVVESIIEANIESTPPRGQ